MTAALIDLAFTDAGELVIVTGGVVLVLMILARVLWSGR